MGRPAASELTGRELEVMHVFWEADGEVTAGEARERLARAGRDRAYTTVATLVKILVEKGFLVATNGERPFLYRPARSFEDVSRSLLGELIERVFRGSREELLVRLLERDRLTDGERARIEAAAREAEGAGEGDRLSGGAER